jgi:hypothetical protein
MLKKSASVVLASLRASTYRSVRLASSLAAALLDSLFEHPETILASAPYLRFPMYWVLIEYAHIPLVPSGMPTHIGVSHVYR